jgi:hypothetical protein
MLVTCNHCGHLCKPSKVDGYTYECRYCDEDLYTFEVTEWNNHKLENLYLDWFNNYITSAKMAMDYRVPNRVMRILITHSRYAYYMKILLMKHRE